MSKPKPEQPKPPEGASPAVEPETEVASPEPTKESGAEESLRLIYAATEEVAQTESEMLDAKEKAKNRTKLWEAAVERQQQVIRKCQAGPGPLFAKPAESKPALALDDAWRAASIDVMEGLPSEMIDDLADVEIDTLGKLSDRLDEGTLGDSIDLEAGMEDRIRTAIDNARAAILPAAVAPDGWRGTLLAELDLSDALVAKLGEAGLQTIGDLADYTASGKLLTDIPGIGAAKATEIEEALVRFWDQRKSA